MGKLDKIDVRAASEAGADCSITMPDSDEFSGIIIRIAGPDSKRYQKADDVIADRMFAARSNQNFMTAQRLRTHTINVLANSIVGWFEAIEDDNGNFKIKKDGSIETKETVNIDGEELVCSVDNAKRLLNRHPWIIKQLSTFIDNIGNFMKTGK